MTVQLSKGCIDRIRTGQLANETVVVQVRNLKLLGANKNRYECTVSDGQDSITGVTTTDVAKQIGSGVIRDGSFIRLTDYACNLIGTVHKLVITALNEAELEPGGACLGAKPPSVATPTPPVKGAAAVLMPAEAETPVAPVKAVFKDGQTPGPTPSPFMVRSAGGPSGRPCQPISALNPYSNAWTIKARVASKAPLRHFQKNGQEQAVFSLEVVDEQGTGIEITLWRDFAEKFYEQLEVDQVYYFRRGSVKLANRTYQNVRSDYIIHMDSGSDIEACPDGDGDKMRVRLKYVGIEHLAQYAGKKMLVDVLGIVTRVGALGSVKRSRDGTELARRDVTIVDQSARTVVVTLWGTVAEVDGAQLESMDTSVLSIASCRVTDFAGVSLSTLSRSALVIDPADNDKANALRAWWDAGGCNLPTQPIGEGLASSSGSRSGGVERTMLAQLHTPKDDLPPAEAKPVFRNVLATVAAVDPAQSLYYEACPENNRKVVQQGEGWYCEYDGRTYPDMVRRYVMQAKCIDASGEATLSVFDDQAKQLLGMSADEIALLKEGSDRAAYEAVLKHALWGDWLLRVQTRTQEYQGELRQRSSIASLRPICFVEESRRMIQELQSA